MIEEDIQQEINKAINMIGQNKLSEAEIVCHEILSQEKNADAYHILSSIKIYKREFKDSIELVKKSISIDNTNAGYHTTLGCAYSASENYKDAISAFNDAIELNEKIAPVHFYQGEAFRKLKKYDDAIACFYKAINISQDYVAAYMLLGIVYQEKKQFDLAVETLKKCVDIMPEYPDARINLAMCYLLSGNYTEGWKEYEWRKKIYSQNYSGSKKEWSGQNLDDKKLLIIDEGSYSDLLQFIRLARELKKDGCKVIIQSDSFMRELLKKQTWIDSVVNLDDLPEHDYYLHVGSLPYSLDYNPNNTDSDFPYIQVNGDVNKKAITNKTNIGLIYKTDEKLKSYQEDSIPKEFFNDLFSNKHNVICLDTNIHEESLPSFFNSKIEYTNANELAVAIESLDVVITVNHYIAHLAGALNKKTYLLLPFVPNWRWEISHISTTPWYKSVRIFRQDIPDEWESVISKVKDELSNYE